MATASITGLSRRMSSSDGMHAERSRLHALMATAGKSAMVAPYKPEVIFWCRKRQYLPL